MVNSKSSNNLLILGITGIIGIASLILLSTNSKNLTSIEKISNDETNIYQNKQIYRIVLDTKIDSDYYDKIYKLLTMESNLENDPYNRKLSSKTVKTFSQIAKYHGIKLDTQIDSKTFDFLYKELVKLQLELYKNGELSKYSN